MAMGNSERLVVLPTSKKHADIDTFISVLMSLRPNDKKFVRNIICEEYLKYTYGVKSEVYQLISKDIFDRRISMSTLCESYKDRILENTH